jgi:hypothetical protein
VSVLIKYMLFLICNGALATVVKKL